MIIYNITFVTGLDRLVEPLRATCTTKVKAHSVKQEFEKQDELKRSAMRAVASLLAIPDAGKKSITPSSHVTFKVRFCLVDRWS